MQQRSIYSVETERQSGPNPTPRHTLARRVGVSLVTTLVAFAASLVGGVAPAQAATTSSVSWVQACFQLTTRAWLNTPVTGPYNTINSTVIMDYKWYGTWYVYGTKRIDTNGCVTVPVATGLSWRLRVNDYNSGYRYVATTNEVYAARAGATYWLGWYSVGSVWVG